MQKSKNQKTGGWVMLGGGVAMTAIGLIMWDKNAKTDPLYLFIPTPGSVFFTVAGIGAVLGSIPFFISSSHNSKKAATISFNNRNILLLQQNSFVSKAQPTVTLKISL